MEQPGQAQQGGVAVAGPGTASHGQASPGGPCLPPAPCRWWAPTPAPWRPCWAGGAAARWRRCCSGSRSCCSRAACSGSSSSGSRRAGPRPWPRWAPPRGRRRASSECSHSCLIRGLLAASLRGPIAQRLSSAVAPVRPACLCAPALAQYPAVHKQYMRLIHDRELHAPYEPCACKGGCRSGCPCYDRKVIRRAAARHSCQQWCLGQWTAQHWEEVSQPAGQLSCSADQGLPAAALPPVQGYCEKWCACWGLNCGNIFKGCSCKGGCKTARQCECLNASRECDPDLCRNCRCGALAACLWRAPRPGQGGSCLALPLVPRRPQADVQSTHLQACL
jgi:hypothetical protein